MCDRPSRSRYVQGCRCDGCKATNRVYYRERQRKNLLVEIGEDVSGFVDAEPVRRKVRQLVSQGISQREICRISGVPRTTMRSLMRKHPRTGKPVRKCKRETKDAICSIKGKRSVKQSTLVSAEVISGHVNEWSEWLTPLEIANALGISRETVYRILHGQRKVQAKTAYRFTVNIGRAQKLVEDRKIEKGYVIK